MVAPADKAGVLGELWINFRDNEEFSLFIDYNDIGLPMAYFVAEGLVKELTPLGEQYIEESFDMFAKAMDLTDEELDSLEPLNLVSIMDYHKNKNKES